ncbi:hypothetical protein CH063_07083, partial [Colletotrichum higginsianum]
PIQPDLNGCSILEWKAAGLLLSAAQTFSAFLNAPSSTCNSIKNDPKACVVKPRNKMHTFPACWSIDRSRLQLSAYRFALLYCWGRATPLRCDERRMNKQIVTSRSVE